jgi:hypothetical protein
MEVQSESYGFKKEFDYMETHFSMQVISYLIAKEKDKTDFHLAEGAFLVHLSDGDSTHSFVVFYNDKLEWDSNVSKLVLDDKDLIEKIGFLIDDYFA